MPLWYSSISAEHQAVRRAAGLFDCSHMGILEVAGPEAVGFLNSVTTNEIDKLKVGGAQYGFILDAAGNVLDDVITYRRAEDRFMMVVNAVNESKIKVYFERLKTDQVVIDTDEPDRRSEYKPAIRDMRGPDGDGNRRVDIALQGPRSIEVLVASTGERTLGECVANLKPFQFVEEHIKGIECLISRTGYTGAKTGFELFVPPEDAARLWQLILEKGAAAELLPCGLGARDSLRIEAGLSLYGHELAGEFNISPMEAGYGWAVKLRKDFFIGKAPMERTAKACDMKVVRVKLPGTPGIRPVRQNDGVLNGNGECIGWVLSCAKVEESQYALAYVSKEAVTEKDSVGVYYLARSQSQVQQGRVKSVQEGQKLEADMVGTVASRFAKF
jgi:glycine hydroxymethyltransferase